MAYYKKANTVDYEVLANIATISATEKTEVRLTVMKWGENAPKYDLRKWEKNREGKFIPKKGITLNLSECGAVAKVLAGLTVEPADYKPAKAEQTAEKKGTANKGTAKKGTAKATEKAVADAEKEAVKPVRRKATAQKKATQKIGDVEFTPDELETVAKVLKVMLK